MSTPITPAQLARENHELALKAKEAAREVTRSLGSLTHACGQLVTHQSASAERWYQECFARVIKANQDYRELANELLQ
jgi:hypothetical protein